MAEQPQGTEYTLQGVMRFLQIEWHNHERARNAWDIERAEMKAKIAKQEGDCRSAKKLNESLGKQIRMLEKALKHERAKNKAIAAGTEPPTEDEVKKEWNGKIGVKSEPKSPAPNFPVEVEKEPQEAPEIEREAQRDKSKAFLQKCVEELTYLLTPPAHPAPPQPEPQPMPPTGFVNQRDPRPTIEEAYLQQQAQKRNQQTGLSHLPSLPNHHPPPVRAPAEYVGASNTQEQGQQAALMSRQMSQQQPLQEPITTVEEIAPSTGAASRGVEDPAETVIHGYDALGRPVQTRDEEVDLARPLITDDTDGWNFDDTSTLLETPADVAPPRRPDTDLFPSANSMTSPKSPRGSHRRKSSGSSSMVRKRSDGTHELRETKSEPINFKVRFALRGHLDVVRSIIFTGGGSPSEPEICTTGDDGMIKRWIIPGSYSNFGSNQQQQQQQQQQQHPNDLDIQSYFTHRGHEGIVTCLAACPATTSFSTGGRVIGDGWIFSGGQDATVRVWERGRVDPKATIDGHTDAVWALCILPATSASVFGQDTGSPTGSGDRVLLLSGSADQTIKIWAVSAPPQLSSPQNGPSGSRRGVGGSRRHSITSGSGFPSSPQPSTASVTPFHHALVHSIEWPRGPAASPTCISALGTLGESFVVSYADSSVVIFDTRSGEQIVGMASSETYDGTPATGVNSVVVTSTMEAGGAMSPHDSGRGEDEGVVHGATGSNKPGGVEGVVITGHEDRFVRFFDANSGQCTYSMLAHPSSIAALSLSPDGRELVSGGHDASLRFWSLEKRSCMQEMTSHRVLRGEGVVSVIWSQDGRWVCTGGGDGVVKVFAR